MSLVKENDVKDPLFPRDSTKIHLCEPVSQPDATGFSGAEPETIEANPSGFPEDFVAEHSSSGSAVAQDNSLISSFGSQAQAASKRVRS